MQRVASADRHAKCLSSQQKANPFTAARASNHDHASKVWKRLGRFHDAKKPSGFLSIFLDSFFLLFFQFFLKIFMDKPTDGLF